MRPSLLPRPPLLRRDEARLGRPPMLVGLCEHERGVPRSEGSLGRERQRPQSTPSPSRSAHHAQAMTEAEMPLRCKLSGLLRTIIRCNTPSPSSGRFAISRAQLFEERRPRGWWQRIARGEQRTHLRLA